MQPLVMQPCSVRSHACKNFAFSSFMPSRPFPHVQHQEVRHSLLRLSAQSHDEVYLDLVAKRLVSEDDLPQLTEVTNADTYLRVYKTVHCLKSDPLLVIS